MAMGISMKEGNTYKKRLKGWMNPAKERLWSKAAQLEETLNIIDKTKLSHLQIEILQKCREDIENAKACIENKWWQAYHPHLAWEFMHRVDEHLILLIPDDDLYSRAIDVKTHFDLNIKEGKVRKEWIGEEGGGKGILVHAIEEIKNNKDMERNRGVVKEALRILNAQMDRTFWVLSMNTLTSVMSGILLGVVMYIFWISCYTTDLGKLGTGSPGSHFVPIAILGLMGAYLSNLLTKEDFLFIRGGPFWRYLIHHLITKPILGAFAAAFIYLIEKSKIIFSIEQQTTGKAAQQIITLNINSDLGYAYTLLAIISGFAADKILRDMIDRVLKKLEAKAEKSKETPKNTK